MEEQERNAIAYALLKVVVKNDISFKQIPQLKRKAGNLARETGIHPKKIIEVSKHILREVFHEQMKSV